MDIDSFNSCLQYLKATSMPKDWVEPYLGIIGTVLGTGLGFGLNHYVTWKKEGRSQVAKKNCCEEDIHELSHISSHASSELIKMCEVIAIKKYPQSHTLPSYVNTPLLEEYYSSIAHSFSINQRYWIKLIFRQTKELNSALTEIMNCRQTSLYKISIAIVNATTVAADIYKLSLYFLSNKEHEIADIRVLLVGMGMSPTAISCFETLQMNIESNDGMLGLAHAKPD